MGLINHNHLGLTGSIASGKTTAANILREQGYTILTFSDILRDEAASRGLEPNRRNLTEIGNELREEHGDGILATRLLEKAALLPPEETEKLTFDGIRHPAEVLVLRAAGFYIGGIDAPRNRRKANYMGRGREGDSMVEEEFDRLDNAELLGEGGAHGQNISACLDRADERIINDGTIDELRIKLGLPPTTVEGQINYDPQRRK